MRFCLLDRILTVQPGKSITAIKTVSLAEEYLGDHFPRFPVLPGVMMLEALTQAAAWTIRLGEDFTHSIVVLRTAKNVKYGDFVQPGRTLTVAVEVLDQDENTTRVKATGSVGEKTSLTARLVLERYNLADRLPHGDALDARVRAEMRRQWAILSPVPRSAAGSRPVVYRSERVLPEACPAEHAVGQGALPAVLHGMSTAPPR
ncbi:MAG: 3-hydroxyacyl-ACP dehydratase FabZ family protein [Pirellulales bacterium]|jgi:3-hydroxyacyl-[acyl-carrier-protein] dehydratase